MGSLPTLDPYVFFQVIILAILGFERIQSLYQYICQLWCTLKRYIGWALFGKILIRGLDFSWDLCFNIFQIGPSLVRPKSRKDKKEKWNEASMFLYRYICPSVMVVMVSCSSKKKRKMLFCLHCISVSYGQQTTTSIHCK